MLKWLDLPPVWLVSALGLTWGLDRFVPWLATGIGWIERAGQALVLLGLASMALGAWELVRHRTTVVPRRTATNFVCQGIYRFSRNPIYLGDALVLAGAVLAWDVLPALVLVPAFTGLIARRFIHGEEAGLRAQFGDEVEAWFGRVRRWF